MENYQLTAEGGFERVVPCPVSPKTNEDLKMRAARLSRRCSIRIALCLCVGALTCQAPADDANPAPFPKVASAILVQGSADKAAFLNDVNSMEGVFNTAAYEYSYYIQKLTTGGAGASQTSPANVQNAMQNAGSVMWLSPVAAQNFVYFQSSHGNDSADLNNMNSTMAFNGTDVDAKTFVGWVQDKMPQGHTQYSSDGASATTCVRNMVYMLEPCYSGGQIFQLTTTLADPVLRKRFFPFLSDITVMTAADYNECSLSTVNLAANTWARSLYGYNNGGAVAGALQTKTPGSVWDVSKKAAQIDTSNPAATVPAYTINAAFGTGNNATMYVPGTSYNDPDGLKEHPLYRHVNFYPALTLRPSLPDSTMGVPLGAEPNSLDMRLNGPNTPGNGPVPLQMSIYGVPTSDTLMVSREKKVWDQNPSLPAGLEFVEYYIFQLSMLNGSSFAGGSLTISYNQDTDPTQIADSPYDLFFEPSADAGWIDLHATQDSNQREVRADIIGANGLGEFALVLVPEPGVVSLVAIACLIMIRRRRG